MDVLKLDRILGTTTLSGNSFAASRSPPALEQGFEGLRDLYDKNCDVDDRYYNGGGDIFYAAGSMVVRYNSEENVQKSFYCTKKAVSSIATCTLKTESFENVNIKRYIAIAERGPNPTISIWDVESAVLIKELNQVHKYGIGCMSFSPNGLFLVSAGFRSDKQLVIWRWQSDGSRELISTQRIGNKVRSICFSPAGHFFITSGDKHLKWWYISDVLEGEALAVEGIAASILEAHRLSVFVEVIVGYGPCQGITFTVTAAGLLCQFSDTTKMMIKQVQLEVVEKGSVHCMELFCRSGTPGLLVVGLSNGSVLCFAPQSLAFVVKLPPPAPLVHAIGSSQMKEALYPACYALRKVPGTVAAPIPKLAAVYADNSFIVWDISDVYNILKHRCFLHHSACIWDLHFLDNYYIEDSPDRGSESTLLPRGTFVTCSADGSIRVWNIDPKAQRKSKFRSVYSKEMLHMIGLSSLADEKSVNADVKIDTHLNEVDKGSAGHDVMGNIAQLSTAVPDTESPVRLICADSPRCLAVHPFGHRIVCGDRLGFVRIFDLASMTQVGTLKAHIAEVLTLSFSPPIVPLDGGNSWAVSPATNSAEDDTSLIVLASAGRDRLIHVFNATKNYEPLDTLDCHTSSVTTARFTTDGKRFISCSGDKTIKFHAVNGPEISTYKTVQTPGNGCINGLCVEASNKFAVTCGQDKKLNVWNVQSGRLIRSYKSGPTSSELYKCDIDPSGTYIATCGFNKTIQLLDFFSGELIAQVSGHSELVTAIKFSPDGRYLLSVGGDGCIFFWKLADSLVKTMQDRLMELYASAQRRSVRIVRQASEVVSSVSKGPDDHTAAAASRPVSGKWAARLDSEKGYELFGRKILPSKEKHKLTLELSGSIIGDVDVAAVKSLEDCVSISIPGPNDLAVDEEEDEESDDEDGSKLFKEKDSVTEKSASFRGTNDDTDDEGNAAVNGLDIAQVKLDMLEQSAKSLETWLEDMLKSETQLDSTVHAYSDSKRSSSVAQEEGTLLPTPKSASKKDKLSDEPPVQAQEKSDGRDLLNQSLSSAFFSSLQAKSGGPVEKKPDDKKGQDTPLDEGKGRSIAGSSPSRGISGTSGREVKRLETQAAVSQMKERLRVMGLLEESVSMPMAEAIPPSQEEKKSSSSFPMPPITDTPKVLAAVDHTEQTSMFFPPPPPSSAEEDTQSNSLKVQNIAAELRRKTADYKRVLSDLDKAKRAASESFSELMELRNSLQVAPSASSTRQRDQVDSLEESVHEADNLLHMFRQSMTSLAPDTYSSSGNLAPMSTVSPRRSLLGMSLETIDESETIAPILEKYSDKLLEMMTRKLGVDLTKKS